MGLLEFFKEKANNPSIAGFNEPLLQYQQKKSKKLADSTRYYNQLADTLAPIYKEALAQNPDTDKEALAQSLVRAYSDNIEFTKEFLSKTSLDVCIYTGHSIEYVKKHNVKGFKSVKCGKFEYENLRESYKTDELIQFASPNQCLYDGEYNLLSENGIYKF